MKNKPRKRKTWHAGVGGPTLGEVVQEFADESHKPGQSAPSPGEGEAEGGGDGNSSRVDLRKEGTDKK